MKVAAFARKNGIRVCYFIPPKVWASRESRLKRIREFIDKIFVIFPFEVDYYARHNIEVDYVGNPLLDKVKQTEKKIQTWESFRKTQGLDKRPVIAILPGSRIHEVNKMLPVMLEVIPGFDDYQFLIAGNSSVPREVYDRITAGTRAGIFYDKTYSLLSYAEAALVTSGTATLEAALFNVPQVVCYKTSPITYFIGKHFVLVDHISLVNLILDKPVLAELIQSKLTSENLTKELESITRNRESRAKMLESYKLLLQIMGKPGAARRASERLLTWLKRGEGAMDGK
jgi:lipid-A-disaccharide synthase